MDRLEVSERLYRQGLEGLGRKRGQDDPDALFVTGNLAMDLLARGNLDEAKALLETKAAQMNRRPGPNHRDTHQVLCNLASLRDGQARRARATAPPRSGEPTQRPG